MKVICEVSRPHYHPGPDFKMPVTKKRELSQTGQWVANERIQKDGRSWAIIMPPREQELWEERQEPHFHCDPETARGLGITHGQIVYLKDPTVEVRVKIAESFVPRVHFDHIDAEKYGVKNGDVKELAAAQ